MIAKRYIRRNLIRLKRNYDKSTDPWEKLYSSKIAILELCGWVETTLDEIVGRSVHKKVVRTENLKFHKDNVVKKNHGFRYDDHFRRIIASSVGLTVFDRVEREVDPLHMVSLQADLNSLSEARNKLAHSYVKGVTYVIDAPTVTMGRFKRIYPALLAYEAQIRRLSTT